MWAHVNDEVVRCMHTCLVHSKGKGLRAECSDDGQCSLYHVTVPQKLDFVRNPQIQVWWKNVFWRQSGGLGLSLCFVLFVFFLTSLFQFISALFLFTVMMRAISSVYVICINVFYLGKMKLLKLNFILKECSNDKFMLL